jgi:hypothetical protein
MDIIVSHVDLIRTATLLRNDSDKKNHWLGLTLRGKNGLASAIGAKVTVITGQKKQVYVNQWTTGYLSNSDPRLHIGLGKQRMINQIEIKWTDGKNEVYNDIESDQYLKIEQGKGIVVD